MGLAFRAGDLAALHGFVQHVGNSGNRTSLMFLLVGASHYILFVLVLEVLIVWLSLQYYEGGGHVLGWIGVVKMVLIGECRVVRPPRLWRRQP